MMRSLEVGQGGGRNGSAGGGVDDLQGEFPYCMEVGAVVFDKVTVIVHSVWVLVVEGDQVLNIVLQDGISIKIIYMYIIHKLHSQSSKQSIPVTLFFL